MIEFLHPDYFEININEMNNYKGGAKGKKKKTVSTLIKEEDMKKQELNSIFENILESTFFVFERNTKTMMKTLKTCLNLYLNSFLQRIFAYIR